MSTPAITDKEPSRTASQGLQAFKRTAMRNLLRTWHDIKGSARALTGEVHRDLPKPDQERVYRQMVECLNGKGGEVSARSRTIALGELYVSLSAKGKERFLRLLADRFSIPSAQLMQLVQSYSHAKDEDAQEQLLGQLRTLLVSDRFKLLSQFSTLPDGFKFLVDMRADLLPLLKKDKHLRPLEADFKRLLSSWFDIGLLELRTIDWNAPASLLEKLIAYEAVHEIVSWTDLKNRLDSDRRCYAFFHPKMPMEPLIFVEVALVNGMSDNIHRLLDIEAPATDPNEADTAIFYSISNAQAGLAGISFGNFLIKRVVDKIRHQLPNVKHFATLSPVPGFRRWLDAQLEAEASDLFTSTDLRLLKKLAAPRYIASCWKHCNAQTGHNKARWPKA